MKKLFYVFFVSVMLIFALCSCQNKELSGEKAVEIYNLANKKADETGNYKIEINGLLKLTVENKEMTSAANSQIIAMNFDTDNYLYQEHSSTTIEYDGKSTDSLIVEGYQDGYMYVYNRNESGKIKKLKSPITTPEYLLHKKEIEIDTEFQLNENSCKTVTANKNDDEWVIKFSNFTEENLVAMLNEMGGIESIFSEGYKISDVEVTFVLDEKYTFKTARLEFKFDENTIEAKENQEQDDGENEPVFYMDVEFTYTDLTLAREINLSKGYTEADDLRYYYIVDKELNKIKNSKDASFELSTETENKSISVYESYEGSYKKADGKLSYEIIKETSGASTKIVYEDGKQTVYNEAGKKQKETSVTELEAKLYLESLLDQGAIDIFMISDIEKLDENRYEFMLTPDSTQYENIANLSGGKLSYCGGSCIIELDDIGKIKSYSYRLVIDIRIQISSNISVTSSIEQNSNCTYEY